MASIEYSDSGLNISSGQLDFILSPYKNPENWQHQNTYLWPGYGKIAPVTLLPVQLSNTWATTISDHPPYMRYNGNHFDFDNTFNTPPPIVQTYTHYKDYIMYSQGKDMYIKTKEALPEMTGLSVRFIISGNVHDEKIVMTIGFGANIKGKDYVLNIWASGKCELFKGGKHLVTKSITRDKNRSILNRWITLFILPYENTLLFTSSEGEGFTWVDEKLPAPHLDENLGASPAIIWGGLNTSTKAGLQTDPLIPASYKIMPMGEVVIRTFNAAGVQYLPLTYTRQSNLGNSAKLTYKKLLKPYNGDDPTKNLHIKIIGTNYSNKLITADAGITTMTTDFNNTTGHMEVIFARAEATPHDYLRTPKLYRLNPKRDVIHGNTGRTSPKRTVFKLNHTFTDKNITGNISMSEYKELKEVYEDREGSFVLKDELGDLLFRGVIHTIKLTKTGSHGYLSANIEGLEYYLSQSLAANLRAFENKKVSAAVKDVLVSAGFPADGTLWDIDDTPNAYITAEDLSYAGKDAKKLTDTEDTTLGDASPAKGKTSLPNVVKDVGSWIEELRETYTSSEKYPYKWVYGFGLYVLQDGSRIWKFYFKNPSTLPNTVIATFYPSIETAMAANKEGFKDAYLHVHDDWESTRSGPEFNTLILMGSGAKTSSAEDEEEETTGLWRTFRDQGSINYISEGETRPINYLGREKKVIIENASITDEASLNKIGRILLLRGSRVIETATMKAEWNASIGLWSRLKIYNYTDPPASEKTLPVLDSGTFWRVTSIAVEHNQDKSFTGFLTSIPATYTLERVVT